MLTHDVAVHARRASCIRSAWGKLAPVVIPGPQARGVRPFDLALLQFSLSALILVMIILMLLWGSTAGPFPILAGFVLIGVVYLGAGLLAWRRRPGNRMGVLITSGGLVYLIVSLANAEVAGLVAIGQIFATVPLALIVHMLLAFPSGRLRGGRVRAIVLLGYVVSLVLQLPLYLFTPEQPPYDLLFVADRPDLVAIGIVVQTGVGILVMVATAVVLCWRLKAATAAQRKVLIPLAVYGIVAVLALALRGWVRLLLGIDPVTMLIIQMVILAGVPVAFALSVLRGGFARTVELDELAAWLSSRAPDRPRLASAVGQALGDPSVTVGYTVDDGLPVDATGNRVLPHSGQRGQVDIDLDRHKVATISYDAELITDPEHVAQAGRLVAIELDRERLTAELLAGRVELHRSRMRIVEEADHERRRIARDLHDGLQAQLVVLSLIAGRMSEDDGSSAAELRMRTDQLRRDLDATAADLRRLVHGLMPAILVERGLYAAAKDFVDVMPVGTELVLTGSDEGLPEVVETTAYFVMAEALTNVVKYAAADHISVRIGRTEELLRVEVRDDGVGGVTDSRGGLRGLADRVTVLGGRLVVESPVGAGTLVFAEVTCAP